MTIRALINAKDFEGLRSALAANPSLANEPLGLNDGNPAVAHPLHRICDGVMNKEYSDEEAVRLAKLFVEYGADINGFPWKPRQDTPLIAASSLNADLCAIYYVDEGANIHLTGCNGATALHWAAWCGRPKVVKRLLEAGANITTLCEEYRCTPLYWAVHGYNFSEFRDKQDYSECIRLLVDAGSDKTVTNQQGITMTEMLSEQDNDIRKMLAA